MPLTQKQQSFIDKRTRLISTWPCVGAAMLALLVGLMAYLLINTPYLINPLHVALQIQDDSIPANTLATMALILPIMSLACMVLLAAIIGLAFAAFANEKKHLRIIEELTR